MTACVPCNPGSAALGDPSLHRDPRSAYTSSFKLQGFLSRLGLTLILLREMECQEPDDQSNYERTDKYDADLYSA